MWRPKLRKSGKTPSIKFKNTRRPIDHGRVILDPEAVLEGLNAAGKLALGFASEAGVTPQAEQAALSAKELNVGYAILICLYAQIPIAESLKSETFKPYRSHNHGVR